MKISGIYKIQSKLKSDRFYIGSAVDINGRWKCHINSLRRNKHHSIQFQRHFNKYGEVDLEFSILLGCGKEDLIKTEQYFLDSYRPYFNVLITAGSRLGMKWSEEDRKKLSIAHIGSFHAIGYHHSEETKRKIGEKSKGRITTNGRKLSPEHKQKIKLAHIGKKHSEEHKKNIGDTVRGRKMSNAFRQKIKDSWVIRKQNKTA